MKTANPAPFGVLSFGLACMVVGPLFAGWFGPLNEGNMFAAAVTALVSGVILLMVTYLMMRGNALADSPQFSMWGGTIFGFFAQVWLVLGLALFAWKEGVEGPLAFMQLYLCFIVVGYLYFAYKLKAWSFVIMFTDATVATMSAFIGLFYGWAPGNKIAGYLFLFLAFLALWIAFKEQLSAVLQPAPREEQLSAVLQPAPSVET